ncbi:uncharacterized protein [Haliotis cracherodii]|uniref:uncharacterized protein n=1 Tax=Haliotis cracherodii TaxID=6455 RepID=UPI0039E904EC
MVTKQVGTFVLCFFTEERKYGVVKTEMIRDLYELVSQDPTLEPQMGLSSVDLWTVDWPERKGGTSRILKCPAILIEHSDDRKYLDNLGKRMQKTQMFPSSRKRSDGGDTKSGTSVSDQLTATNTDMTEAQASTNISKIGKRGGLKDVLAELKKRHMEKGEEMDVSPPKDPPKLEDLRKENRHLKEELEKAKAKVDLFKLTPQLVKQLQEILDRQAESSPVSSLPFSDDSCDSTSASPNLPSCTPSRPSSPTTPQPSSTTTPSPTSPVLQSHQRSTGHGRMLYSECLRQIQRDSWEIYLFPSLARTYQRTPFPV